MVGEESLRDKNRGYIFGNLIFGLNHNNDIDSLSLKNKNYHKLEIDTSLLNENNNTLGFLSPEVSNIMNKYSNIKNIEIRGIATSNKDKTRMIIDWKLIEDSKMVNKVSFQLKNNLYQLELGKSSVEGTTIVSD